MATYYLEKKSGTYTVSYRLKGNQRTRIYGIKSEAMAKKAVAKKGLEEELSRADLMTPDPHADKFATHARLPIDGHVTAFERSIRSKGGTHQHAQQQAAHVRRLVKMSGARGLNDLNPEAIQEAAKDLLDGGLSARTCNAAIQAVHQFGEWLRRSSRWRHNVLIDFTRFNEAADKRHPRREMEDEEIIRTIEAAESGSPRKGRQMSLGGRDRAMLYRTALYTGFRQAACLTLKTEDFHVDPKMTRPWVGLWAGANKNRRYREQPIPRDVAVVLFEWLAGKPAGLAWAPSKHAHKELWMRRDMDAARAAWIAEATPGKVRESREASDFLRYEDSKGRFADFHGWRHTGISRVVRGAGLKAGQVWADHSSPVVTARYAHMNLMDEAKSLESLPPVAEPAKASKKKTG